MSVNSTIEWTQASWNPVTGCEQVSPGCAHCYAQRFAERFRGVAGHPYEQGFDVRLWPERLDLPLRWKKPRTIFVNSMSDLFQDAVPLELIKDVFEVMRQAEWHTFQVLTKRAERLREVSDSLVWPANVWMGVSIENQRWACRADALRDVPAAVRFLSCEPLLRPLRLNLDGIQWVIVGGESGPGARPMKPDWVRSLQAQCQAAGVSFFFKQWGGARKKKTGRLLDGRYWNEMPPIVAGSTLTSAGLSTRV